MTTPPSGDTAAVAEAAKMLVAADNPVIVAGRSARTPEGVRLLVELAETLQCGVCDQHLRMNFPTRHPLYQEWRNRAALADADVILGLETVDFYGTIRARVANTAKPLKVVTINSGDLYLKSNYQDFQRYTSADLAIAADAEATLPALIEACKKLITGDRKRAFDERGKKLAEASAQAMDRLRLQASYGWDSSPISTARVSAELWPLIKDEDWSYVSDALFFSFWPLKLWDMKKHYQYIGNKGGAGIGYGSPAAVGAAVANRKHGRLTINIQSDGDFMYAPGVLWTAAHHKIPMLTIMHNNRAYHQEVMGIQGTANHRSRGIDRIGIGTKIEEPFIDYSTLAKSLGVASEGPIKDPKDLAPAFKRGIEIAKRGEPYLIDVWTQGR
jgi:acetolactate synthase-1/2/3 large subunit